MSGQAKVQGSEWRIQSLNESAVCIVEGSPPPDDCWVVPRPVADALADALETAWIEAHKSHRAINLATAAATYEEAVMPKPDPGQSERPINVGIKDPVRLFAEPVGIEGNKWALIAVGADGSRLTIIASGERFEDALRPRGFSGVLSEAEQVREMFIRDEATVLDLEAAIDREARRD